MQYPKFPSKASNSVIGICAPSAGVGHKLESFDCSLDSIRSLGFNLLEEGKVRVDSLRPDTGSNRGYYFNELVSNPDVDMIISASGGEFCFEVLPYIDISGFAASPKWVCGASDPTSILYYLTTACDIATIYGFNAGTFDWRPLHPFQERALSIIQGDIVEQTSFDKYDNIRDYSKDDITLNGDVYWELYNCKGSKLEVDGRLIGGCIDVLANMPGTPFDYTREFLDRYADEGIIWYFDPFEMNPISLHLQLLRLKYAGWFKNTKAVIIGRIMFDGGYESKDFVELLKEDFDCPFIFNADIGHVKPCMTMINGAVAHLCCEDGKGKISMKLE